MIRGLKMHNWQCFRGTQTLKLGSGVYAITARYETDPDKSNAGGKTSLLEAIEFALYGQHRWPYEDDWITEGEDEGSVTLYLENVTITRSRKRGKSTQLLVEEQGIVSVSSVVQRKGDEAQAFIDSFIGLSNRDFRASSYLRQKQHSLFVTGDPSERRGIISEWFDLDKVIAAEKFAKGKADAAEGLAMSREVYCRAAEDRARALVPADAQDVFAALSVQRAKLEAELQGLEARKAAIWDSVALYNDEVAAYQSFLVLSRKYEALIERGKRIRKEADELAPGIEQKRIEMDNAKHEVDEMVDRTREYGREVSRLKKLQSEGFDGLCPVTKGACPVPEHVNQCRDSVKKQLEQAQLAYDAVVSKQSAWTKIYNERLKEVTHYTGLLDDLEDLRAEAKASKPTPVSPPGENHVMDEMRTIDGKLGELQRAIGEVDSVLKIKPTYDASVEERDTARAKARQWQKVRALFGKNHAQRKIAEEYLHNIEERANELLRLSAIDLTVQISWVREGSGLSDDCEACGIHYPSKGGKTCERCGTARGPKLIQKLEVILSDRSGALEDLGGIAIQMAASEWLRLTRGSRWHVLMIDEPFGALDKTNRLAMSATIVKMLSSWDQAFVISHTPDTALSMPKRIEIVVGVDGSKAKVV